MTSLIFRALAPLVASLMVLFSFFVTLRGHNEPGGGFIGGLIAASALAVYGIGCGVPAVRRALPLEPLTISALGLALAASSAFLAIPLGQPFMTGLWWLPPFPPGFALATPIVFDLGVYLVVVGAVSAIALALEAEGDDR